MKRILASILLSVMVISCTGTCVLADNVSLLSQKSDVAVIDETVTAPPDDIKVLLDGEYINFDVKPVIIDNRTMVPVRAIFEALGAQVDWIEQTKTVVSKMDGTQVKLTIGEKLIYKNSQVTELDVPALIVNDRTLVPVRAISEAYDCFVQWNSHSKTVVITSGTDRVAIAKVNGEAITMGYYNIVLAQIEDYAMQSFNCGPGEILSSWNNSLGDISFGEYMATTTLEQCIYTKANAQMAKSMKLTLNTKDKATVNETIANMKMPDSDLSVLGTDEKSVREFLEDSLLVNKYCDVLLQGGRSTDTEIKKYLNENYITAKHILFMTIDPITNMPLSSEETAAKKALAEDTLKRIKAGQDFDKLMLEFSEDPGVKSNPDGYLFTKGDMVQAFENTAFSLKVGSVSGIVQSEYGYHIIKRVENAPYTPDVLKAVSDELMGNKADSVLSSNKTNSKIEVNDKLLANIVPVGLE